MKRKYLKFVILIAVMTASGLGTYHAYHVNEVTDDALLAENLEALSNPEAPDWDDEYDVKGDPDGKCIKFTSEHNVCPERGEPPVKHGKHCDIVTYKVVEGGYTYKKKRVIAAKVAFYSKWKDEYKRCKSGYTKHGLDEIITPPETDHTYAD